MNIYTAHYKYNGPDRIDITVKSAKFPDDILAPTWNMVKEYKAGTLSQWDYTVKYFSLIISRFYTQSSTSVSSLTAILNNHPQITLVCFCSTGEFCHRILAARMIENMGYGNYIGELKL